MLEKYSEKSFGGKIVLRQKSLRFWMVSGFESKIYFLLAGKILQRKLKVKLYDWFLTRLFKIAEFFSLWQPYIVKK